MKSILPRIFLITLVMLWPLAVFGQSKIEGNVVDDKGLAVSSVRIVVTPGGQANTTDSKGHFWIGLPNGIGAGVAARIVVHRDGWLILSPRSGACTTQALNINQASLPVVIVPRGSTAALEPAQLSKIIAAWAAEKNKMRREISGLKKDLSEFDFFKRYAEEYGFTLEQFREAAEKWAVIKDTDAQEDRAAKEFWKGNYAAAAQLLVDPSAVAEREALEANQKALEAGRHAFETNVFRANSLFAADKLAEALNVFNHVSQLFDKGILKRDSLALEWIQLRLLIANVKLVMGARIEGRAVELFNEAVAGLRDLGKVVTRENSPELWAATQFMTASALWSLGTHLGADGTAYLDQSRLAYGATLEIITREKYPVEWAVTSLSMASVLQSLGGRIDGRQGIQYLNDAAAQNIATLQLLLDQKQPDIWSLAANNLGTVFWSIATRTEGAEKSKYLEKSIAAFQAALTVRTRERTPKEWATTQINLAETLTLQASADAPNAVRYLTEALAASRSALEIITREAEPREWANAQNNLGRILMTLGAAAASEEEAAKRITEAIAAFRAALEVSQRERLPYDSANNQVHVALGLVALAAVQKPEAANHLAEALTFSRAALGLFTREHFPRQWGTIQSLQGSVYLQLNDWAQAAEAYANVLEIQPDDSEANNFLPGLYLDKLHRSDKAYELCQRLRAKDLTDIAVLANCAEAQFATGRFAESRQTIEGLLSRSDVPASITPALRAIEIVNLLAEDKHSEAALRTDALISDVAKQAADFQLAWSSEGVLYFVNQEPRLASYRPWLGELLNALSASDRDSMIKSLQTVQLNFPKRVRQR